MCSRYRLGQINDGNMTETKSITKNEQQLVPFYTIKGYCVKLNFEEEKKSIFQCPLNRYDSGHILFCCLKRCC